MNQKYYFGRKLLKKIQNDANLHVPPQSTAAPLPHTPSTLRGHDFWEEKITGPEMTFIPLGTALTKSAWFYLHGLYIWGRCIAAALILLPRATTGSDEPAHCTPRWWPPSSAAARCQPRHARRPAAA